MTQFSDPAWWPRKPPEPPKQVPLAKILFGTLVPALVIGGIVAAVVLSNDSSKPVVRSVAAYESCVSTLRQPRHGDERQYLDALNSCRAHLPAGVGVIRGPTSPTQAAYDLCVESGVRKLEAGALGRSGRGALQKLEATCEALASRSPAP